MGIEPVKPKSRKPLILKESSKYNTLQPHNHADNRTEKVFRVAFCTVMQHEYATRNKAAGSLLATLTTPSFFVPKVHHMIHPIHLLLPPIAMHICAVCHIIHYVKTGRLPHKKTKYSQEEIRKELRKIAEEVEKEKEAPAEGPGPEE